MMYLLNKPSRDVIIIIFLKTSTKPNWDCTKILISDFVIFYEGCTYFLSKNRAKINRFVNIDKLLHIFGVLLQ